MGSPKAKMEIMETENQSIHIHIYIYICMSIYIYIILHIIYFIFYMPVVPHKAVEEVSKIGNL